MRIPDGQEGLESVVYFLSGMGYKIHQGYSGNFLTRCPAHSDSNPSLSIKLSDTGKLLLKCFAGCSYDSIVSALASMGYTPENRYTSNGLDLLADRGGVDKPLGLSLLNTALTRPMLDDETRQYLQSRQIPEEAWEYMRLSSSQLVWKALTAIASSKMLLSSGLARWRGADLEPSLALKPNRLVIPYIGEEGIYHLSSRTLIDGRGPRYASPPGWGSEIYPIGVSQGKTALLVEGELKAAILYFVGKFPAISIPGVDRAHKAVVEYATDRNLRLIVLFDSEDKEGVKGAASKLSLALRRSGVRHLVVWLPRDGHDRVAPDDLLLEVGRHEFKRVLQETARQAGATAAVRARGST